VNGKLGVNAKQGAEDNAAAADTNEYDSDADAAAFGGDER